MKFYLSLGIGLAIGAILVYLINGKVSALALACTIGILLIGVEQTILDHKEVF